MWSTMALPYESRYYGILVGLVLVIVCYWFGLGIIFETNFNLRMVTVVLPLGFFLGYGLFVSILPVGWILTVMAVLFYVAINYLIFLLENVFMVAIGYKTVPLYRAAYTTSLIVLLLSCFFLFDSMLSFNLQFYVNWVLVFIISVFIFWYHYWTVEIELTGGRGENGLNYVLIPAWLMSQLGLVFSFWPVGVFKGSIYLVSGMYILLELLGADLRGRLFRRTWIIYLWVSAAVILGILIMTGWGK